MQDHRMLFSQTLRSRLDQTDVDSVFLDKEQRGDISLVMSFVSDWFRGSIQHILDFLSDIWSSNLKICNQSGRSENESQLY